jgi:ribosomal protein S18 acetylase RimI-like enzyme
MEIRKLDTVEIREVGENDIPTIVKLLDEIDQFYGDKTTEGATERADAVASALFGKDRSAYALLASTEKGHTVGFASYSFLWPAAGSSRSLYLKELYVSTEFRTSGTGRLLMQELFRIAKREQCSRVEWTTDTTNIDAQAFYEKLEESAHPGKVFYRHEITP